MKKMKYILFLLFLSLFSMVKVDAKTEIAKCVYNNYVHPQDAEQKKYQLTFTLYDDSTLSRAYISGKQINYERGFDKEFINKLYPNKKLSSCPNIYICNFMTPHSEFHLGENTFCSENENNMPIMLEGTLVTKNNADKPVDKSKVYCTRNKSLRNETYTVDVTFYLDSNGNKRFKVFKHGTSSGTSASYDKRVSLSDYSYSIAPEAVNDFYSDKCSSTAIYFDLNNELTTITITSIKPKDYNNGAYNLSDAKYDEGQDTILSPDSFTTTDKNRVEGCAILGGVDSRTVNFLSSIVKMIRFAIPIIIIILGIVDFLSILFSGEEKVYKNAFSKFVKRIIVGISIILIPYIISFVIRLSGIDSQYGIDNFFCGIIDSTSGAAKNNTYDECINSGKFWLYESGKCVETIQSKYICESNNYRWEFYGSGGYCKPLEEEK